MEESLLLYKRFIRELKVFNLLSCGVKALPEKSEMRGGCDEEEGIRSESGREDIWTVLIPPKV